MADLVNLEALRNGSIDFTWGNNGAATQTIPLIKRDEKFILLVKNTDVVEARIRISGGIYIAGVLGSIYKDLVQDAMCAIGPLEGSRFKNVDGKLGVLITGTNDGVFGGTVTNVKLAVIELP